MIRNMRGRLGRLGRSAIDTKQGASTYSLACMAGLRSRVRARRASSRDSSCARSEAFGRWSALVDVYFLGFLVSGGTSLPAARSRLYLCAQSMAACSVW